MKILIVKLSSLGDIIQTLPVVQDLHDHIPHAVIDWVAEESFADLLSAVPGIRFVHSCAQRRWRKSWWKSETRDQWHLFLNQLQSESYDVVLDAQGLIKSALITRQARLVQGGFRSTFGNASAQCGYERPVRWFVDRPIAMPWKIHAVDRTRLLAAKALGYSVDMDRPQYPMHALPRNQRRGIFIGHGTTRLENEWPSSCWLDLAQRAIADGHEILIPQSGAQEHARAKVWVETLGSHAQLLPPMKLSNLLAIMQSALGTISVDSGLGHLAVALGLPVVQIFSQPRIERAGPKGFPYQIAVGGDHAPDVDTVWNAWCQMLALEQPI